ncbi:MAG: hypothetical protein JEZ07_06045 [Phycisphaerae bacterium]|nr:hypothetical protein [Phycisphaerae bacterium]
MKNIVNFLPLYIVLAFSSSIFGQEAFILSDSDIHRVAVFNMKNELLWEYPAGSTHDVEMLANGNVIFSTAKSVCEVTPDKKLVWEYKAKGEVFSVQKLKNGNTLTADAHTLSIIEIDSKGKVVKELKLDGQTGHGSLRLVRETDKGYLLALSNSTIIREYSFNGKILAELKMPGFTFQAIKLSNGHFLASHPSGIIEFDGSGKKIREFKAADHPKLGIRFVTGFEVQANGDILVANWLGHGHDREGDCAFLLDKNLRPTWRFADYEQASHVTQIHFIDKLPARFKQALPKKDDVILFDFEDGMQGWETVAGNFGKIRNDRDIFHGNKEKYNKKGKYFLNTLDNKDGASTDNQTGQVESPVFTLLDPTISLIIGGGNSNATYAAICDAITGKEYARCAGLNKELMRTIQWHVPELLGKKVFVKLVDENTGGWGHITMDNLRAIGKIDMTLTNKLRKQRKRIDATKNISPILDSTLAAINDLENAYPDTYPAGKFRNKITELQTILSAPDNIDVTELEATAKDIQRQALLANPLITDQPLLFVTRKQYKTDHHNTATLFQTDEVNTSSFEGGGALKTLDVRSGKVTTLIDVPEGIARDPEVNFDGKKIILSMRHNIKDDYSIYEINNDGTGLRQLTSTPGVSDIDPIYLPDGNIVFSSTRQPKYCMCNKHIMANMFRMDGNGDKIHQLGKSTLFEGHSALLNDGRIIYDRWEYVDRNFGDAQGLWTVHADGTNHAIYWGNNTNSPGGVIDPRAIPDSQQILCIFGSCHDRPWGTLTLLDRREGIDNKAGVIRTWPAEAIKQVGIGNWDAFLRFRPRYEDPFPLNDKYFLCSRSTGQGEQMGIYLVDIFGNEIQIHVENNGCFDPMPIRTSKAPPTKPSRRDFESSKGQFYVVNVYDGTHMQGVKPGSVKYLRVIESPEKRYWNPHAWSGQGTMWPAMNWHSFENKKILGTVPVENDGSAYFEVPAEKFVFFQLLDKDMKMIQSMRSGSMVQPGEFTGCVGCHDDRHSAPEIASNKAPIALTKDIQKLNGFMDHTREMSFMRDVQPIFNKHCMDCHDYGKKAAGKLLLAPDRTIAYNAAYNDLWRKGYTGGIGAGPAEIQQAYSWGSHKSKLIENLEKGHNNVKLSKEEMQTLYTWLDMNAVYYPTYACAYPNNPAGRSPLTFQQSNELGKLTGINFTGGSQLSHSGNKGAMISFDRPELSRCLEQCKNDADRSKALAIIIAGQTQLAKQPRADMENFIMSPEHQKREDKYQKLQKQELQYRKALSRY